MKKLWVLIPCLLFSFPVSSDPPEVLSTATAPYTNFESGPVLQLLLDDSGERAFLLNTKDHRLEIYRIDLFLPTDKLSPAGISRVSRPVPNLVHKTSIFTGLEPVSMAFHPIDGNRLFVANLVSDTVSVVNLETETVEAVIPVGDEPRDLQIVGEVLYVACTRAPRIQAPEEFKDHALVVCQVDPPYARQAVHNIQGHKPRSLATDGRHVYVVPQNSGNHTTLLKDDLAGSLGITQLTQDAFDTNFPLNEILLTEFPNAERGWNIPQTGRIVFDWEFPNLVPQLPDRDIVALDTADGTLEPSFATGVGTTLFAMERNPVTGDLWVANTEARNRTRMEYNLLGATVNNRITIVESTPGGKVRDVLELAPPLTRKEYAQPHGIAFYTGVGRKRAYVATLGSAAVLVFDAATGTFLQEIPTGNLPGGLAVDSDRGLLYVYCRGEKRIRAYDIRRGHLSTGDSVGVPYDPEPPLTAEGRRLLYDARSSTGTGNGNTSCATCHVFADVDQLAWDLGNSQGGLAYSYPGTLAANSGFAGRTVAAQNTPIQNPMKGPLTTQTLRGISDNEPLHWRGDRRFFQHFQSAFVGLNGGTGVSDREMQSFAAFVRSLQFPPNPLQSPDRVYRGDAASGMRKFGLPPFTGKQYSLFGPGFQCVTCHEADFGGESNYTGSRPFIDEEGIFQLFNTGQLRGILEKRYQPLTGFGTHHDGVFNGTFGFLDAHFQGFPAFDLLTTADKIEMDAFLNQWDPGVAPLVGDQIRLDAQSIASVNSFLDLAESQAERASPWIDLIAKGRVREGKRWIRIGLVYGFDEESDSHRYLLDDGNRVDRTILLQRAASGDLEMVLTAVLPGLGRRLGVDRDEDGLLDGIETRIHKTRPDHPDTDRDGYDDATEVALGGDPLQPDETLPDAVAPQIERVAFLDTFVSTTTLEVLADEPCRLDVRLISPGERRGTRTPVRVEIEGLRKKHQVALTGLREGHSYEYRVAVSDRNGNRTVATGTLTTAIPHYHIDTLELVRIQAQPTILEARFRILDRAGVPVHGLPLRARLKGEIGANPTTFTVQTDSDGRATRVLQAYTPSAPGRITLGVDFLGSLNPSHPFFVGRGNEEANFFYEQSFNRVNSATATVE